MKLRYICAIALLMTAIVALAWPRRRTKKVDGVKYELVFADEFNKPDGSQPDSAVWARADRYGSMWARWNSNREDVLYIKNGKLVCLAKPNDNLEADTAKMVTGAIWSRNLYAVKYGKIEVRMRTNLQQGNFPAAWLRQQTSGPYAEIDIVEMFGYNKTSFHTLHTQYTSEHPQYKANSFKKENFDVTRWHIYSIEWDENHVKWTVDGKEVGNYLKPTDEEVLKNGGWSLDVPHYIILNQAVGDGRSPQFVPHTDYTYRTEFDWIRIYQRKE